MKKFMSMILVFALTASVLTGCGGFKTDESAIKVNKNGSVIQATIDTLDQDYYDSDELKEYVEGLVSAYLAENDATIKMTKFKVSDDVVTMYMTYDNAETYSDFNGTTLFVGTVAEALAAGYDFDTTFYTITNGASADADSSGNASISGNASGDAVSGDVTDTLDANVVILSESISVTVPGTITYVSANGTKMTSLKSVSIDNDASELTYIVYE